MCSILEYLDHLRKPVELEIGDRDRAIELARDIAACDGRQTRVQNEKAAIVYESNQDLSD